MNQEKVCNNPIIVLFDFIFLKIFILVEYIDRLRGILLQSHSASDAMQSLIDDDDSSASLFQASSGTDVEQKRPSSSETAALADHAGKYNSIFWVFFCLFVFFFWFFFFVVVFFFGFFFCLFFLKKIDVLNRTSGILLAWTSSNRKIFDQA